MSLISRVRQRLIIGHPTARPGRAAEFVKTMLVVVPLTVLIWIYAERAQIGPDKVSLLISAGTVEPNLVADILESDEQPLTINLNGPRGQVEALKQRLDKLLEDGRYKLTLSGVDAAVGQHTIDAAQLLNRDPIFANSGVTVTGTAPAQLRVNVDAVISRPATVVLSKDGLKIELLNQSFDPPTLMLSGPQSAFPSEAPTVSADASSLTPGDEAGEQSADVPVQPPDHRLRVSASKVKMTYTAGSMVTTVNVATVFIDVVRPIGDEDGKSKVVISSGNVLHNVQIRGPTNLVSKYASGTLKLSAQLYVSHDDIGQGSKRGELKWPPIEDGQVKPLGGPPEVTYEVVREE